LNRLQWLRAIHGWIEKNPGTASWVQAVGVIVAVLVAFIVGRMQISYGQKQVRNQRHAEFNRYARIVYREVAKQERRLQLVKSALDIYLEQCLASDRSIGCICNFDKTAYALLISTLTRKLSESLEFTATKLGWSFDEYIEEMHDLDASIQNFPGTPSSNDVKLWLSSLNDIQDVQKGLLKRTIRFVHRIGIPVEEVENVEEA